MLCQLLRLQTIYTTDHFLNCTEAKLSHNFTQLLCNKPHIVNHMIRVASKVFAKLWILCCNTYRTGIQLAHTHHDAAHYDKWCCCKPKLLSSKQCCNCNISAIHHLTVSL